MPSVMTDTSGAGHLMEQSLEYHVGLHCTHWQRGVNVLQLGVFCFVIASAPQSPPSQDFVSISQISPAVQSLPKHEHEAELEFLSPLISKHDSDLLQKEDELVLLVLVLVVVMVVVQNSSVSLQEMEAQRQVLVFGIMPSV